jgi:hypothetical protein
MKSKPSNTNSHLTTVKVLPNQWQDPKLNWAQTVRGCGWCEPKEGCQHGAMHIYETTDGLSNLRAFYLRKATIHWWMRVEEDGGDVDEMMTRWWSGCIIWSGSARFWFQAQHAKVCQKIYWFIFVNWSALVAQDSNGTSKSSSLLIKTLCQHYDWVM